MNPLVIGLLSGTSMDGIDAVLARIVDDRPELQLAYNHPFDPALQQALRQAESAAENAPIDLVMGLSGLLAVACAEAVHQLLEQAGNSAGEVLAIGLHGQTLLHRPNIDMPYTLQVGDPDRLALATGIPVVDQFRRSDVAAGGQGAPLAPLLHREVLGSKQEARAVLNLGGIANLTLLDTTGAVKGWDTGPANCLLDAWCRRQLGQEYDLNGSWAGSGQVQGALLDAWLKEDYFGAPAPKSTGTDLFNLDWLQRQTRAAGESLEGFAAEDVQASLAELTVETVARSLEGAETAPARVLVCGGGVHNGHLMARLARRLQPLPIAATSELGLDPDAVEGLLFAWLAWRRMAGLALDTGPVTGAGQPLLMGSVSQPFVQGTTP